MKNNEIIFKKEGITKEESINMLDIYYSSNNEEYKFWFKEITPFKDFKNWGKIIVDNPLFNSNTFNYKWTLFKITELENNEIYLKWYINNKLVVFFSIYENWLESININKMISLESWKWIWKKSLKNLCDYYKKYEIIVRPSWTGILFWYKMQKEYKWVINIIIKELWHK